MNDQNNACIELLFNFAFKNQGNGQKPSPSSALAVDLSAATKLKSYFPNPNLKFNFLGHSLGCAVVTQLAAQPSISTDRKFHFLHLKTSNLLDCIDRVSNCAQSDCLICFISNFKIVTG